MTEMREKISKLLEKRWAAYTFALCAAVLLYVLLTHMTGPIMGAIRAAIAIATPVITGVVLAYLIDPLAVIFERRVFKGLSNEGLKRTLGIVLAFTCVVLAIVLLVVILVPALVNTVAPDNHSRTGLILRRGHFDCSFRNSRSRDNQLIAVCSQLYI